MLLDMFITHWTEPWEVGKNGFGMLSLQRAVDWSQIRITLVHDGTEPFPDEYFDGMPFTVSQFSIPTLSLMINLRLRYRLMQAKILKMKAILTNSSVIQANLLL